MNNSIRKKKYMSMFKRVGSYIYRNSNSDFVKGIIENVKYLYELTLDPHLRALIKMNRQYKDAFLGRRCFVLGNGPSLKNEEIELLKDEIIFTVNSITEWEKYAQMNARFHVMIDPEFFDSMSTESLNMLDRVLKELNRVNKSATVILSYKGESSIKKLGHHKWANISYIYANKIFREKYNGVIDMAKQMPAAQTVIQTAIYSAIYMGFKEIYLLGCDMNIQMISYDGCQYIYDEEYTHIYNETDEKRIADKTWTNEKLLLAFANMFTIYRRLKTYCENRNIKIINAAKGGKLDVFERETLGKVLEK